MTSLSIVPPTREMTSPLYYVPGVSAKSRQAFLKSLFWGYSSCRERGWQLELALPLLPAELRDTWVRRQPRVALHLPNLPDPVCDTFVQHILGCAHLGNSLLKSMDTSSFLEEGEREGASPLSKWSYRSA